MYLCDAAIYMDHDALSHEINVQHAEKSGGIGKKAIVDGTEQVS